VTSSSGHTPTDRPAPSAVRITALICSWNRSDMLEDTVNSLLACRRGAELECEIVVVDNASTDDTSARMKPYEARGDVRLFLEKEPGLSNARNLGVREARGDWILFLDDDVLLPELFLVNYARAIRELVWAGFLAGPVIPAFDHPLSPSVAMILREHSWCFSALELGGETRELAPGQFPFGANMAIRAEIARQFPFESGLGFKHGSLVPGEETALFRSIAEAGYRGAWIADVPLRHRLPANRATARFLLRRAFGQGQSDAIVADRANISSRWVVVDLLRLCAIFAAIAVVRPRAVGSRSIEIARRIGHLSRMISGFQHH
jgi:glycosyltransferase involved in cell wall biosynthesis